MNNLLKPKNSDISSYSSKKRKWAKPEILKLEVKGGADPSTESNGGVFAPS